MKRILIIGGNSGIGLECARQLTALGHEVTLLGRDAQKGRDALAELKNNAGKSDFLSADLSTHAGVRAAAAALIDGNDKFDVLLHTSGVLMFEDVRTADGLHPFFAVNYLSRYHLTQLLLPLLRKSESPRVIMLSSHIPLDTQINFDKFPQFVPFNFGDMTASIQFGNHHYAAYLCENENGILSAVVNAGLAETAIWREFPAEVREKMLSSRPTNSIPDSAIIPIALCLNDSWAAGSYWGEIGNVQNFTLLELDTHSTERVISISRQLTGA